jgi:serine/threonine protein kinase
LNDIQQLPKTVSGHTVGGRYRVVRPLGVGGFSQTFLAEDTQLPDNPRCVVKQLRPQMHNLERWSIAKRLFDTEAKVLYQLGHHDQIPRLFAHFEDHQEFYLVQELVEGQSLQELFLPTKPWTEQRAIILLRDILQILVFVHGQNVIHRDIKPSNLICRRQDGRVMLIDFGAVKQVSAPLPDATTGQAMTIAIGTPGYVPTEQLSGSPRFNSDIYAVGMIGIQILTGIFPHLLQRDIQTGEIIWTDSLQANEADRDPAFPATEAVQVSPEVATILNRMVCYHFRDRYQMATEPLQALEELIQQRSDIVPTLEFSTLAAESALAWEMMERATPSIESSIDLDSVIPPTAFTTASKAIMLKTDAVIKSISTDSTTFQPRLLQGVGSRMRSILQNSFRGLLHQLWWNPNIWKIGIMGGVGIAAIALYSEQSHLLKILNRPRSTQSAPTVTPILESFFACREPSPPALSSREPDYEYPDGTRFYGSLVNGRPTDGRATMVFPTGNRYDGELKGGQRSGCGIYTFANGKRYIGQFKNDRFEGQGTWILQNGDRYIGSFQNNRCQGQGVFIFANGASKRGTWQDGNLVNSDLSCNR